MPAAIHHMGNALYILIYQCFFNDPNPNILNLPRFLTVPGNWQQSSWNISEQVCRENYDPYKVKSITAISVVCFLFSFIKAEAIQRN